MESRPLVRPGTARAVVFDSLGEYGPMTMAEVCEVTGIDKYNAAAILMGLNKPSPRKPKRVYITKYVFDHEGARRYPRAVYDIGDKPDAPKPKSDERQIKRRYRAAKKARMKTNFVFNLAQSVRI